MEVRPIDANALREKIMTENYDNDTINNFLDLVDFAPTLNYEPVVHCKDCKYFMRYKEQPMCNKGLITAVKENHFCSYGAKMDKEMDKEVKD